VPDPDGRVFISSGPNGRSGDLQKDRPLSRDRNYGDVRVLNWIRNKFYARYRRIDMDILWPACRDQASDLDRARAAFACHALHDLAWMVLGEDEICRMIDGLE
jgi:hypothetical protein